ncbi:MAG TPA: hypothetical protein VNE40_01585 [Candidatus Dormibacteraeota bacterium]|nr:hypothetical protein [Candidatus Dormibacteraeota bacterium]
MGLFTVPVRSIEDVQQQLARVDIGNSPTWVGPNQRYVYIPEEPTENNQNVRIRAGYEVEKSVSGPFSRVPDGQLLQLLVFDRKDGSTYSSVLLPTKTSRRSMVQMTRVNKDVTSIFPQGERNYNQLSDQQLKLLDLLAAQAIFETVNTATRLN